MIDRTYIQNVLSSVNAWLDDAEKYCQYDTTLGNVLEYIRAAQRQTRAASDMVPRDKELFEALEEEGWMG